MISKTNSGCQIKVNDLLDELKISYDNEKGFYKVAVDNYLKDYIEFERIFMDYVEYNNNR